MNKTAITVILGLIYISSHCQEILAPLDSLKDSTEKNSVEQTITLMKQIDSLALADSINRAVLTRQLEELRSFEKSKRKKLEADLSTLRQNDSARRQEMNEEIAQIKQKANGYPVIVHKDTVLTYFTKLGPLTPAERAQTTKERLLRLYRDFFIKRDSLYVSENIQSADIYFNDRIILSVTELDEMWFNKPKIEIAFEYRDDILTDMEHYSKDRSILKIFREIGLVVLIISMQAGVLILINHLFRSKISPYIWTKRGTWFKGITINKYEVLNPARQTAIAVFFAKILRFAIIFILLYLSIPLLFSIFPPTQRFAEALYGYILSPLENMAHAVYNYIPELITIFVIITVTRYLLKLLKFISDEIGNGNMTINGFFPDWAIPTYNIIRFLILAFMFVAIFPYLPGSDSPIFKGVSVFLGVVFSLSSSSIIGNMVAGIVITYMRPFKIGDRVKIGEVTGNVAEKTPFVTRIQTPKKEFITIPNSNVLSQNVINYSNSKLQGGLIVHTTVTIGYDVPWRLVHQILINAAKKTSHLNMDIVPYVLQTSLDDFYVSYQLNAHTNEPDRQPLIYSELHQNIQDGFNEAGLEILSPHYRAERDGSDLTIPPQYKKDS